MTSLSSLMTADHRRCDDFLAAAEQAIAAGDQAGAKRSFAGFQRAMLAHFDAEERILFPVFEAKTGMSMGPTQVMRFEHAQMRGLLDAVAASLEGGEIDDYVGQVESLLIMMQQHNMKEENVLYPMCDQQLPEESPSLVRRLDGELAAS